MFPYAYFLQFRPNLRLLSLSQMTSFRLFQDLMSLQTTMTNLMKITEKLSKWVENTAEKGEIARCEQFLFLLQFFQKTCTADK